MSKILFIFLTFFIVGCTSVENEPKTLEETENPEDITQILPGLKGLPEEVLSVSEETVDIIEKQSGILFINNGDFSEERDIDAGNVYSLMYFGQSFEGEKIPGFKTMQIRLMIDRKTYQLNDICIINPAIDHWDEEAPRPSEKYEEIYYNQLWPTFVNLDFDKIFNHRPYKIMEKSDDSEHSENKFYTEYVVDFANITESNK